MSQNMKHAIMRKKTRKALYQPFPKGTLAHDLIKIINEQGLPDAVLGEMCGIGRPTICNWRTGARTPRDIPTIEKVARRCGYRLTFIKVRSNDND